MSLMSRDLRRGSSDRPNSFGSGPGTFERRLGGRTTGAEGSTTLRALQHLAEYSARHAEALRALSSARVENLRRQSLTEWCEHVLGAGPLRQFAGQAPSRDAGRNFSHSENRSLLEWDPDKHPRAPKGQPDGGQWVAKNEKRGAKVELDKRMVIPTSISPNPAVPDGGWWVLKKGAKVTGGGFDRNAMAFVPRRRKNGIPLGRMVIPTSISPNPAAPNGGWWVLKKGAKVTGGGFDRDAMMFVHKGGPLNDDKTGERKGGGNGHKAVEIGQKLVKAGLTATAIAIALGHHWLSISVAKDKEILPRLSRDARIYLIGAYSGETNPHHGNITLINVTHPQYSKEVRKQLAIFIDKRVGKAGELSGRQMEEFIDLLEGGKGADGTTNTTIETYNEEIKRRVKGGYKPRGTYDEVMKQGEALAKNRRFRSLMASGVIAVGLADLLAGHAKALEVAGTSHHLRDALDALARGELLLAESILIGNGDSLYQKLLTTEGVGAIAALNFEFAVRRLFNDPGIRAILDGLDGDLND